MIEFYNVIAPSSQAWRYTPPICTAKTERNQMMLCEEIAHKWIYDWSET